MVLLLAVAAGCTLARSRPEGRAPTRPATGLAAVNGTTLYYEAMGTGEPVVLLQGGNLDLQMWDDQFAPFAEHFRVIRYDVRGFGRSGSWGAPYEAHEDLRALLDHLGIVRAHLVGLSLGGRIAVDFALEHPERVGRLVLAGPGLSGFAWSADNDAWYEPVRAAAEAGDSLRAAELWLESPFMAPAMGNPDLAPRLLALARANARVWAHRDTERPLEPPAVGRLGEIQAPTLLLVGSREVPDIERIVDLLDEGVAESERVVFDGAGHMLNLEQPGRFNAEVLRFLQAR